MQPRIKALVLDDGELGQVRDALDEFDARAVYRRDRVISPTLVCDFDLLFTSGRRALAWRSPFAGIPPAARPLWFAFHHQDFLPLRERLRRQGVDFLVHSTVDREVFRLLLQSVLFEGAGKRRVPRLPVGAPVTWQSERERFAATLADLGPQGCRLFSTEVPKAGERLRIELPASLCEGAPMELHGVVTRVEPGPRWSARTIFGVEFAGLSERSIRVFSNLRAGRSIGARISCLTDASLSRRRSRPQTPSLPAPAERLPEEICKERRVLPRVSLRGHSVTLLGRRSRLTAGQNLSMRAVRVTRISGMGVGDALRVVLRQRGAGDPLVLPARVARDDGSQGLLLRFDGIQHALLHELERLVASLPPLVGIGERDGWSAAGEGDSDRAG